MTTPLLLTAAMVLMPTADTARLDTQALAAQPAGTLSILETAASTGRFDTLAAALTAADLVTTLSGPGPFTVFAPTDEAFAKLPPQRLAFLLQPENVDYLKTVLTFHVVDGNLDSTQVLGSPFITTLSGQRADVDAQNLTIDGAAIAVTDIVCNNGIIHIIDDVMLPELRTITQLTAMDDDFSTLNAALGIAGLDDDLDGPGPFTVFAPTNRAFNALPPGVLDSLINDPAALSNVLLFHATQGRQYADQVVNATGFTMLNNASTAITVNQSGVFIEGSQILVTDIETWNGVVHVSDAVLVPGP